MQDMRLQIATTAMLNYHIIARASQRPEFHACTKAVLNQFSASAETVASYNIAGSAAHYVSLLYCLILVPKELYVWPENHEFYKDPAVQEVVRLFKTTIGNGDDARQDETEVAKCRRNPGYYLMRRLRNSLAHANFSIWAETKTFEFRDRGANAASDDFVATINTYDLVQFLSTVGSRIARYESEKES